MILNKVFIFLNRQESKGDEIMDLSIVDKISTFFRLNVSSFMVIEEFLIFLILLIFLIYNEKVKNKFVKYAVSALLLFIFSLFVFFYKTDVSYILTEIGKIILNTFYFPNLVFYVFTVFCSLLILIITIFKTTIPKWQKIVSYVIHILHLYLFIVFISYGLDHKLSFTMPSQIYKYDDLFVIVQASQILFIIFIIYYTFIFFYRRLKLKKEASGVIMDRK